MHVECFCKRTTRDWKREVDTFINVPDGQQSTSFFRPFLFPIVDPIDLARPMPIGTVSTRLEDDIICVYLEQPVQITCTGLTEQVGLLCVEVGVQNFRTATSF